MSGAEFDRAIGVGLIGYGLAGASFHAPLIEAVRGLALCGIVSSRPACVNLSSNVRVVATPEELFADPAIELVVIATPDATHAQLARGALTAGKHVVIDKPFVTDPADGAALIELAEARGLMLSAFHNRRWDSDFLTVCALLEQGVLGEIALAELRWDRFRPAVTQDWRESEGAGLLDNLGPHLFDQALQLFGKPEALTADLATQRCGAAPEDYFEATLYYGARRVIVSAATLLATARPRFALHGTRGSFVKHGIDPQEAVLRAGHPPTTPGFGEDTADAYGTLTASDGTTRRLPSERGDWRRYYVGIATAIKDGTQPPVLAQEAQAIMELISLARHSAAEGRRIDVT